MTVKWGIIGVGGIGSAYVQAMQNSQLAQLVAVADTDPVRAKEFAESQACDAFENAESMLEKASLDAVLICTPPVSHGQIAVPFLRAKVPVLCEKPFTITTDEAKELIAEADRNGVLISMASKFRFVDGVLAAHELVRDGGLGTELVFKNAFLGTVDMRNRWNADATVSGGGVLIDNGTHSLDIAQFLLGPIARLSAQVGESQQGLDVEEAARIHFKTHSGAEGTIDLSWNENGGDRPFLEIQGTRAKIAAGWKETTHTDHTTGKSHVCAGGYSKFGALQGQIDDFSTAVTGGAPSRCQPDDAIQAVRVVNAAYQSIREGRAVDLDAPKTASR